MKLTEIKEGVLVRCSECGCGKTEEGYVEGKIYFKANLGCGCRDAYHKGNDRPLAYEICPTCDSYAAKKRWEWGLFINPSNIKVIREGKG